MNTQLLSRILSHLRGVTFLALLSLAASDAGAASASAATKLSPLVADEQTMRLFEFGVMALVAAFVVIFVLGSRSNLMLAREVAAKLEQAVSMQFAQVGTGGGKKLVRDGQSYFWFYATGRKYTSGIMVLMDFAKRMDVFSYTSSFMTSPQKDRVIMYLPITSDVNMEPMSLLLVTKKELARLRELNDGAALKAAETFAVQAMGVSGLPSDFVAMSEHPDIVTALLPDSICAIILENAKFVNSVHVAENGTARWDSQSRASSRLVRVDFNLPTRRSLLPEVVESMVKVALHLVDAAAETKLTVAAKKKAMEIRRKADQEVERIQQKKRAEEAAARRLEKRKEEEEAVGKMSREKQMKYEEKKRKKELNARMRKAIRK